MIKKLMPIQDIYSYMNQERTWNCYGMGEEIIGQKMLTKENLFWKKVESTHQNKISLARPKKRKIV